MYIEGFENFLVRSGKRKGTIDGHLRRIRQLIKELPDLSRDTFERYLTEKYKKGVQGSSLNRLIITLRAYSEYEKIEWIKSIRYFKVEKPVKKAFSDEEILQVILMPKLPNVQSTAWIKWTMWLKVIAFSGMRPNEVSCLTVNDVDWGTNNFILDKTKTEPRKVPIAKILHSDLQEYMKDKTHYLFPTPKGHFESQGWSDHLNKRLNYLGIKRKGLTAHSFRHSFISNLWQENAPLPDIMSIVGHKDVRTTLEYSHLGNKSAQKTINRHSIIQKSIDGCSLLKLILEDARSRGALDRHDIKYDISANKLIFEFVE